jgi:hypothetical protein
MKVRVLLEVPAPPRVDRDSGLRTPVKQFESARWYRKGDDPAISTVSKAEQRGSTPRLPAHSLGRVAQPGRGSRSRTCVLRVRVPPRPPLRINKHLAPMRCRAPRPASGPRVRVRPSTHRRCGRFGLKPTRPIQINARRQGPGSRGFDSLHGRRPCSSVVERQAVNLGRAWPPLKGHLAARDRGAPAGCGDASGAPSAARETRVEVQRRRPSSRRPPPALPFDPQPPARRKVRDVRTRCANRIARCDLGARCVLGVRSSISQRRSLPSWCPGLGLHLQPAARMFAARKPAASARGRLPCSSSSVSD